MQYLLHENYINYENNAIAKMRNASICAAYSGNAMSYAN